MTHLTRRHLAASAVDDFRRIIQRLRTAARQAERELGISGAQLFVLQKLADKPAASLNELAGRTLTHQSSVSVVVQRLVERGLVARDRSAADGRRIELQLTPAGKRLVHANPMAPQIQLIESVRAFPDEDLRNLARLLHQLAVATGAARLQPHMLFADSATSRPKRNRRGSGRRRVQKKPR